MQSLEIGIVESDNSRLVDLFDLRHARKVLMAFGRAFGALPEKELSKDKTASSIGPLLASPRMAKSSPCAWRCLRR
jgi:hypothetical protein